MPEALALLEDFIAEGTGATVAEEGAAATAQTGEAVGKASPVSVETPAAVEAAQQAPTKKGGFSSAIPALSEISMPKGGIALLLTIALLLIFAIVPAPGQDITRLSLLWKAIIGQATLSGTASGGNGGGSNSSKAPVVPGLPPNIIQGLDPHAGLPQA